MVLRINEKIWQIPTHPHHYHCKGQVSQSYYWYKKLSHLSIQWTKPLNMNQRDRQWRKVTIFQWLRWQHFWKHSCRMHFKTYFTSLHISANKSIPTNMKGFNRRWSGNQWLGWSWLRVKPWSCFSLGRFIPPTSNSIQQSFSLLVERKKSLVI